MQDIWSDLRFFSPELALSGVILLVLIGDLLLRHTHKEVVLTVALAGLLGTLVATHVVADGQSHLIFSGMVVLDPFAVFFKYLAVTATAIVVIFSMRSPETPREAKGEFTTMMLAICLGMMLMAAASDLLMVYLAVEISSVVGYILAGFRRGSRKSAEAALKYIIYGGVASGIMLYGMSLLYGLAGSTSLFEIRDVLLKGTTASFTLLVAVILVFAGIGYKIASVPFHMWCPDVYEGAPTPVTALLSVGPKAAGFAVLVRFFFIVFVEPASWGKPMLAEIGDVPWPLFLAILSMATMTLGNLSALGQTNIKRFFAYSSIAHAGYMLMGAAAASQQGLQAMLFYLVVYLFMNLGAFLVVIAIQASLGVEEISDYRGLAYRSPWLAVTMAIFLFSLTGVPPFAGFIGKLYLFAALLAKGGSLMYILAIVGIVNSVVSLYYYARVVRTMFLDKPVETSPVRAPELYRWTLAVLVIPIIVFGLYWAPLDEFARQSLRLVAGV
jgi:NADH-quinone oxidoreductase subunit N